MVAPPALSATAPAAATGARDACLEPRYVFFFEIFYILLNKGPRRPTQANAGER